MAEALIGCCRVNLIAHPGRATQQRAAAILSAPPKVPGDDAASAQAQIDAWIAGKGAQ